MHTQNDSHAAVTVTRVVDGALAGLVLKSTVAFGFRAVEITHEKIDGFCARCLVSDQKSEDWILAKFAEDVRLKVA